MATHRIPILGFGTKPDNSGDVFFEPYSIKATNDLWERMVAIFKDSTTRNGLHGGFAVPKNYGGTSAKIIVVWTSTINVNYVAWDFDYRAVGGDDVESLDQATAQESVNFNDAMGNVAHERMEAVLTLTAGNFAVDDEVEFTLFRDGTDAADTMAGPAILFGIYFEYDD